MKLGTVHYIDCAHFLPGHPKCGQLHGHTYKIEVIIEGENKDGMVIDFADMKKSVNAVLREYDHKSLNNFLDYPSVENICELLHARLKERLPLRFTIRVWEGDGKWAEL
jgi:6-pyruvoyltetrahydropterin/6-carboxytetrahydropterin synthase